MNNIEKIEVNGKSFVPCFGMKFFRLLAKKWELLSINAVIEKLAVFEGIGDVVTFEQIDIITDMIRASIIVNPDNEVDISEDEIGELFLQDLPLLTEIVEKVMKGFIESMPKTDNLGKQIPEQVKKAPIK